MALLFAAHRWGNGAGIYDYESEANAILDTMLSVPQPIVAAVPDGAIWGQDSFLTRPQH